MAFEPLKITKKQGWNPLQITNKNVYPGFPMSLGSKKWIFQAVTSQQMDIKGKSSSNV